MLPDGVDARHTEMAANAWRAHTRLARGDVSGAMPIYAQLSRTYLWQVGPQSLDVCDGLTRCLIASEKRLDAIEPMLATFAAMGSELPDSIVGFDQTLKLRKDLPPVFQSADMGASLDTINESLDARASLMHAYFQLANCARNEQASALGRIEELKRQNRSRDAGLVLFEQMVFAQAHPDESKRRGARESLTRRTQTQRGTWIEVWARLAIGAGQIRDEDPYIRDRGVIELVHIIVRLGDVDPGLTLLAAQIAERYLRDTNRCS